MCVSSEFTKCLVEHVELTDAEFGEGLAQVQLVLADGVTEQQRARRVEFTLLADDRHEAMQRHERIHAHYRLLPAVVVHHQTHRLLHKKETETERRITLISAE